MCSGKKHYYCLLMSCPSLLKTIALLGNLKGWSALVLMIHTSLIFIINAQIQMYCPVFHVYHLPLKNYCPTYSIQFSQKSVDLICRTTSSASVPREFPTTVWHWFTCNWGTVSVFFPCLGTTAFVAAVPQSITCKHDFNSSPVNPAWVTFYSFGKGGKQKVLHWTAELSNTDLNTIAVKSLRCICVPGRSPHERPHVLHFRKWHFFFLTYP